MASPNCVYYGKGGGSLSPRIPAELPPLDGLYRRIAGHRPANACMATVISTTAPLPHSLIEISRYRIWAGKSLPRNPEIQSPHHCTGPLPRHPPRGPGPGGGGALLSAGGRLERHAPPERRSRFGGAEDGGVGSRVASAYRAGRAGGRRSEHGGEPSSSAIPSFISRKPSMFTERGKKLGRVPASGMQSSKKC